LIIVSLCFRLWSFSWYAFLKETTSFCYWHFISSHIHRSFPIIVCSSGIVHQQRQFLSLNIRHYLSKLNRFGDPINSKFWRQCSFFWALTAVAGTGAFAMQDVGDVWGISVRWKYAGRPFAYVTIRCSCTGSHPCQQSLLPCPSRQHLHVAHPLTIVPTLADTMQCAVLLKFICATCAVMQNTLIQISVTPSI
jgi:hypothetical protein